MKFNVNGKALQDRLNAVSKVVNSKNPMSILDNFLLSVEGDVLTITGSDTENTLSTRLEVTESESDGAVAVLAKRMLDIFKEVGNQPVTVYVNEETLEIDIKFLSGHFNFTGINSDEYPRQDQLPADAVETILPAKTLLKGIETTLFAVATDTIRPVMTGIYVGLDQEKLTFASTDTHKLVRYIDRNSASDSERSFILPAKPAAILRALMAKEEGDVRMRLDSKRAVFEFGEFTLYTKFILGNFPPFNKVIPDNNPFVMSVDRNTLLNAMRRVSLFASAASCLVRLNIQPNEIFLVAQDLDYATSAEERVSVDYEGNSMTVGLNATYMIEVLQNLGSDMIQIHLADPSRPCLFVPMEEPEGTQTVMLLMPMQVVE